MMVHWRRPLVAGRPSYEADRVGRAVGRRGAPAPAPAAPSSGRTAAHPGSSGLRRDSVCAPHGNSVGVAPAAARLRQRDDLLAALTRLAAGGRVAPAASGAAQ